MVNWIQAGSCEALEEAGVVTLQGKDRQIALFADRGFYFAVDNRCPHMGFPLHQGSVQNGILTCHWHHARFALDGGCAFDLFADDVPTYPVKVEGSTLYVGDEPEVSPDRHYYLHRLNRGMEQNLTLLQAKSIIGLRERGESLESILGILGDYGSENHETWRDGMTLLGLVAGLSPALEEKTLTYALTLASSRVAGNCDGQPRRRERGALDGSGESLETLTAWADRFVQMRHRDGLERTLMTFLEKTPGHTATQDILGGAILSRIYMDTGHLYDFLNKAIELAESLPGGEATLEKWIPLLIREAVEGMGEEDKGAWRNPEDLVGMIRDRVAQLPTETGSKKLENPARDAFEALLLGEKPEPILDAILTHLCDGVAPEALARSIAQAAGWRMARFAPGNDLRDWFSPLHAFTYSNALVCTLRRTESGRLLPGLLHGAMAVYQDRFLNVPTAYYPESDRKPAEGESPGADAGCKAILELLDRRPQLNKLVRAVTFYIRDGHPLEKLVDCLAWATIREDLDFHKLQALEAAYRLSREEPDRERIAVLFAGVSRYLGSHCPTARSRVQPTDSALKLHRGEPLSEKES